MVVDLKSMVQDALDNNEIVVPNIWKVIAIITTLANDINGLGRKQLLSRIVNLINGNRDNKSNYRFKAVRNRS